VRHYNGSDNSNSLENSIRRATSTARDKEPFQDLILRRWVVNILKPRKLFGRLRIFELDHHYYKLTSNPKVNAIMVMRKPKKSSSFRSPYLSKSRKVKVSTTVISTPPQIGILLLCRHHHILLAINRFKTIRYINNTLY